jgi:bifunctional NMN adenylyltransferase/nudix hydrolase
MQPKTTKAEVGVIVGRFQVHSLHEAHKELILSVFNRHPKVIIILGLSPCKVTLNNPLDFEARKQMILDAFPQASVVYIKDMADDSLWSKKLDEIVKDLIGPNQKAVLYGGRDSFISSYNGKLETCELEPIRFISGTEIRKDISVKTKSSADFRAGAIWATSNQWHHPLTTVDIAICSQDKKRVLLARKPYETKFRFVGGFASNESCSFAADAIREVSEETHLETSSLRYIGSTIIDDWRYRNETNKIKTIFFYTEYLFGVPKPDDDVAELRWFELDKLSNDDIVKEHNVLLEMLKEYLNE